MEYIFGVVERNGVAVENLKTVGDTHSNLSGFANTVREYQDCIITDRFKVMEKYRSDEDAEGNYYDWYVISEHYRYVDNIARTDAVRVDMENLMCDIDETNEIAHAAYETALCDIDEAMNGGNASE